MFCSQELSTLLTSTQTAAGELRQILTDYCNSLRTKCAVIEKLRNLLSKVADDQRCDLLASIRYSNGHTVLTRAAFIGHTELCVTLLSSLPQADRLKLILDDKHTALHSAAAEGHTETVSGELNGLTVVRRLDLLSTGHILGDTALHTAAREGHTETVKALLNNLTPEQQLHLLFTQNSVGDTALHYAALWERPETVKTLLDNLTPESQLKLLSAKNGIGKTASQQPIGIFRTTDTMRTLEQYQTEADYRVNYRKFASLISYA